jgi:hypothetical protein
MQINSSSKVPVAKWIASDDSSEKNFLNFTECFPFAENECIVVTNPLLVCIAKICCLCTSEASYETSHLQNSTNNDS